jgi:hypothetical protein
MDDSKGGLWVHPLQHSTDATVVRVAAAYQCIRAGPRVVAALLVYHLASFNHDSTRLPANGVTMSRGAFESPQQRRFTCRACWQAAAAAALEAAARNARGQCCADGIRQAA